MTSRQGRERCLRRCDLEQVTSSSSSGLSDQPPSFTVGIISGFSPERELLVQLLERATRSLDFFQENSACIVLNGSRGRSISFFCQRKARNFGHKGNSKRGHLGIAISLFPWKTHFATAGLLACFVSGWQETHAETMSPELYSGGDPHVYLTFVPMGP